MKSTFIVLLASSLFKILESASIEIIDNNKIIDATNYGTLIASEIEDSSNLIEKKLKLEEESLVDDLDLTTTSGGDSSPIASGSGDNDKDSNSSDLSISSSVSNSDCSAFPQEESLHKSDQDLLLELNDALHLHSKNFHKIAKLLGKIHNWKLTYKHNNFSVLSLLSRHARPQTLGRLIHQDALEMFAPLMKGTPDKLSGGYFYALALFLPSIQCQVINQIIHKNPHIFSVLLLVAIYFRLNEQVVYLILESGAEIKFGEIEEASPLTSFASFNRKNKSSTLQMDQVPVPRSFFMNFFVAPLPSVKGWEKEVSTDPEVIFLDGMLAGGVPEECGAFKIAFNNYGPKLVYGLMEISPNLEMKNYHLAHFLALNPKKQNEYPAIENLVNQTIVFDRLSNGFADVVALAILKKIPPSVQVSMIKEFIKKTTIFHYSQLDNPRIIITKTTKKFSEETGIYELPSSPAHTFFLTACKSDLADEAFMEIFEACQNIRTSSFHLARQSALDWVKSKKLEVKIALLSENLKV